MIVAFSMRSHQRGITGMIAWHGVFLLEVGSSCFLSTTTNPNFSKGAKTADRAPTTTGYFPAENFAPKIITNGGTLSAMLNGNPIAECSIKPPPHKRR